MIRAEDYDGTFDIGKKTASSRIRLNNISLKFEYAKKSFRTLHIPFENKGGGLIIAINGELLKVDPGKSGKTVSSSGKFEVAVTVGSGPGGSLLSISVKEGVQSFLIGGQELWINSVLVF